LTNPRSSLHPDGAQLHRGVSIDIDPSEEVGRITARLPVVDAVCQPMGIVHGVCTAISRRSPRWHRERGAPSGGIRSVWRTTPTSSARRRPGRSMQPAPRSTRPDDWVRDVEMRDDDDRLCATSRVTIAVR
jgi:hypothetical protein